MDKPILSASVENILKKVAKETDNILSESAIELLDKHSKDSSKVKRFGKVSSSNFSKILSQIPGGIYTSVNEVTNHVRQSLKMTTSKSLTHSPMVVDYAQLHCCRPMTYGSGHIVTGRDIEIDKILSTLCKQSKRGIILVGQPGTGKSAIARAVGTRLIERTVPRELIGVTMLRLDIPYIFTKYKDDPIGTIVKTLEIASSYDRVVLFIDEVHQLLTHKMNDIMKPYLTEKLRFIGATTVNEYHSIITEDSALERRFTLIHVDEPSIPRTIDMVEGTKSTFEVHHKCTIPKDICKYLVENGSRFLGYRRNPDKSLDLLDIACTILSEKEANLEFEKKDKTGDMVNDLNIDKDAIESMKLVPGRRVLNEYYVDLAISNVTGISYGEVRNSLSYKSVCKYLNDEVVGQSEQVATASNVVNVFKHISYSRERPVSVLLFVGPPGVGKKTLAQKLAKSLYGSSDAFLEFDMSGMTSEFMITELKGAPPGYVGYGKSGGFIKKLRNNPQSLVYFRGIDKANETIKKYIIDMCRKGRIVDSAEREANLNNAVIVLSSTLDSDDVSKVYSQKPISMGFSKATAGTEDLKVDKVKEIVGEATWRVADEMIVFNKLNEDHLEDIFTKNVNDFMDMYEVDIDVEVLKKNVLDGSEDGHDVMSKLASETPKLVFKKIRTHQ